MRAGHLDNYAMSPFVYAVAARTALHQGDVLSAQRHLAHAARLRPLLTSAMPHRAVQTLLELARTHLTLTDAAAAKAPAGRSHRVPMAGKAVATCCQACCSHAGPGQEPIPPPNRMFSGPLVNETTFGVTFL
jgi:hypothetical protein